MDYLTVGSVSAIIAAVVAILQLIVPNALILILTATLSDQHTAVTWSVVARVLGSSQWPLILRSDTATSNHVAFRVNLITWLRPIGLFLIAVAAVVTPIGLYESIELSNETEMSNFVYAADIGPLGLGTPPRSQLGFSRQCGYNDLMQCPGTNSSIDIDSEDGAFNVSSENYDLKIPKELVILYQSGLKDQMNSVSSFLDIEYRQYVETTYDDSGGQRYLEERYRSLASFVLNNATEVVEGLIVDTKNKGVGFRNHTIPVNARYGAEWIEDILFLEPETVCVDTNVSFLYELRAENTRNPDIRGIKDNGGFVNLNKTDPYQNHWPLYEHPQEDPGLWQRAYRAAWSLNVLNMYFLNVSEPDTNLSRITSRLGKHFDLNSTATSFTQFNKLEFETYYENLVNAPSSTVGENGSIIYYSNYTRNSGYANPWNITTSNYSYIPTTCSGTERSDYVNGSQIQVYCGLMFGIPRQPDGSSSLLAKPGSSWERGIYSCASGTKATIKSVRFRYNSTGEVSLKSLQVLDISEKKYSNKSSVPIWGIETPNPQMSLIDLDPLWGLVEPSLSNSKNLTTVRQPNFYIPASSTSVRDEAFSLDFGGDFLAGTRGPAEAWSTLYGSVSDFATYSGDNNLALYSLWRDLSKNSTLAPRILDLIFTDFATNALVGTKSWPTTDSQSNRLSNTSQTASVTASVPVYMFVRRIHYHWEFGIPAFIAVLLAVIICIAALISVLSGRGSIARVRRFVLQLSAGRILASFIYPLDSEGANDDTKAWIQSVGHKPILLTNGPLTHNMDGGKTGKYSSVSQNEPEEQLVAVVQK